MTASDPQPRRTWTYFGNIRVDEVKGIGPRSMEKLNTQGIYSVADLLMTVPRRYLDRSQIFSIGTAPIGEEVTVSGTVTSFFKRRISRGRTMVEAKIRDETATVRVIWFNPYISLKDGDEVALSGRLEVYRGSLQMKGPALDRLSGPDSSPEGRVVPVYPSLGGLKPHNARAALENALKRSLPMVDSVPEIVLAEHGLADLNTAMQNIHFPESYADAAPARRRLIFDEFLRIQMALRVRAHDEYESRVGIRNAVPGTMRKRFIASMSYRITGDQRNALSAIIKDMEDVTPMHRLLQGEVGSGKTVVMIAALLASVESGHQGAVMAPTEVLATQHYLGTALSLQSAHMAPSIRDVGASGTDSLFTPESDAERPIRIGLFTSARVTVNFVEGDVSRRQGLAWLADGTIDIAFGTQALIQSDVEFASLGMTVVDEQHRFGVEQRVVLRDASTREGVPDLLLMTATPIPRTLAMTLYGDLEVSVIYEMPSGRQPVRTSKSTGAADADIDDSVRAEVTRGHQVFVVCPLVEDSGKIEARSAISECARVETALPEARVGLLHGQLRSEAKASVMAQFAAGEIDVLVSTTVIEVGIDVPNATLIVIRDADRFGLSQLHQLRGRVGRGSHQGSCILVSDDPGDDAQRRIDAMIASNDGFELAEVDLEIRGQGTVFAGSQSGAADLRLGDILKDRALLEAARTVATTAVESDRQSQFVSDMMAEVGLFFGRNAEWLSRS